MLANHRFGGLALYGKSGDTAAEWSPAGGEPGARLAVVDGKLCWSAGEGEAGFAMPVPCGAASAATVTISNGGWLHLTRTATVM
mmetsp:Transcript_7109/g.22261  ORF Transcript_7109/g.22261 Transcript_7109/m.22261 type:complete len:84 (+) Transcript_7109:2-253(+)